MGSFRARLALAATLFLPVAGRASSDVTVVVDMTPEGRKAVHPTPDRPTYYRPLMGIYHEMGKVIAGEKPPSIHPLVHLLAEELAKQGYLVAIGRPPGILVDLTWGYIDPTILEGVNYDLNRMNALVLGHTFLSVMPWESFNHQEFVDATMNNRYFVIVTAFDFAAWEKHHRELILWQARMSVPKQGMFFDDAMPSLVKAGGPSFGRETIRHPRLAPAIPDGQVEVGTPTVRSYGEAAPGAPVR